jgi:hypothetical protein
LVDPADEERRQRDRDHELQELRGEAVDRHRTKKRSASSVQKL